MIINENANKAALFTARNTLHNMDNAQELRRAGLSLSSFHCACSLLPEICKCGNAKTFDERAACFLEGCGFSVVPDGFGQFVVR